MNASTPRCELLLVDDDVSFRETLALILRDEGVGVRTAGDGQAALERLRDGTPLPDMIFTDLVMPRLSGWDLIDQLRLDGALRSIPIVVLSGDRATSDRIRQRGLGQVLQKPFHLQAVLHLVELHCGRDGW